jgi:hypothetical protein
MSHELGCLAAPHRLWRKNERCNPEKGLRSTFLLGIPTLQHEKWKFWLATCKSPKKGHQTHALLAIQWTFSVICYATCALTKSSLGWRMEYKGLPKDPSLVAMNQRFPCPKLQQNFAAGESLPENETNWFLAKELDEYWMICAMSPSLPKPNFTTTAAHVLSYF